MINHPRNERIATGLLFIIAGLILLLVVLLNN